MARGLSLVVLVALALLAAPPVAAAQSDGDDSPGFTAPPPLCPGQTRLDAPSRALVTAMHCMVDFARAQLGLGELAPSDDLTVSARRKARDLLRCQEFSHFACGRDFKHWIQWTGYISTPCWRVGENLAWGKGELGTARSIFRAWMRSESHRANLFGDFEEIGVGVRVGRFEGRGGARVWAQHFGSRCGAAGAS